MFSKGSIDDFQNFRTKRFRFIFVLNLLLGQLNDKYRTTAGLEKQNLTLLILLEGVHRNKIYLVNFRVVLFQIKNVEEVCNKDSLNSVFLLLSGIRETLSREIFCSETFELGFVMKNSTKTFQRMFLNAGIF